MAIIPWGCIQGNGSVEIRNDATSLVGAAKEKSNDKRGDDACDNAPKQPRIYGQLGDFTTNLANKGGISASSLNHPQGIAVTPEGVYIADEGNHRVLFFPGESTVATRVYGQKGSFTSNIQQNGGLSANSLYYPYGLAADSTGLYVSEPSNARVLFFPNSSTTATRVYGQLGRFDTSVYNAGGINASSLNMPLCVALDGTGVYISDLYSQRVTYYPGTSTVATRVYGQGNSFSTQTANKGGISADSLYGPRCVAVAQDGIYISDQFNYRLLFFPGISTTATRVYNQSGSFTTSVVHITSAEFFLHPYNSTVIGDKVFLSDQLDNRVLRFSGGATVADKVYGQMDDFSTNTADKGGVSSQSLYSPTAIVATEKGLYIADYGNNRVLFQPF